MKAKTIRLALLTACAALAALALSAPAQAAFGLNEFHFDFEEEGAVAATEAGAHPYQITSSLRLNYTGEGEEALPEGEIKDLAVKQIPGLVGDPTAVPKCSNAVFLSLTEFCSKSTQLGETNLAINFPENEIKNAVYNLEPPPGVPARIGFKAVGLVPVVIDLSIDQAPPYEAVATFRNVRQTLRFFGGSLSVWGVPADHGSGGARKPFLTLPASCQGPQQTSFEALSWQGETDSGADTAPGFTGCEKVGFAPQIKSQATTDSASSASGLDFEIDFEDEGLKNPEGTAQSEIKEAVVKLPAGVTANPSLAEGLGACSMAQVGIDSEGTANADPAACPNSSKIGTVLTESPLLEEAIEGSVYVATPNDPDTAAPENPFNTLIAFYIVLENENLGIRVKLPAEVTPNPVSGQLETRVRNAPQLPVSRFAFHFREGQRAPLITPPACGTYTTEATFTPWANPGTPLSKTATFQITHGVGEGPVRPRARRPSGRSSAPLRSTTTPAPTRPSHADNPRRRRTGHDPLRRHPAAGPLRPPGGTRPLPGGPDRRRARQRAPARSSPAPPARRARGSAPPLAGAGVGSELTYVPGSLYLAGPYNGAPLSVVAITPALAGPFDAGTVVVREALQGRPPSPPGRRRRRRLGPDPPRARRHPPEPRDLRVSADRPDFTLNPTSCERLATEATLWGADPTSWTPPPRPPARLAGPLPGRGLRGPGLQPAPGPEPQGRHPPRRLPRPCAPSTAPDAGDANFKRRSSPCPTRPSSNRPTSARSAPACSTPPEPATAPSARRARSTATPAPRPRCSTNRSRAPSSCAPRTTTCPTWCSPCTA